MFVFLKWICHWIVKVRHCQSLNFVCVSFSDWWITSVDQFTNEHQNPFRHKCHPFISRHWWENVFDRVTSKFIFRLYHCFILLSSAAALNRMVNSTPRISPGFSLHHFPSLLLLHFLIWRLISCGSPMFTQVSLLITWSSLREVKRFMSSWKSVR